VGCSAKKVMETRVVSSMAREVAYTLTMLSANFITQDTSRPLRGAAAGAGAQRGTAGTAGHIGRGKQRVGVGVGTWSRWSFGC